MRFPEKLERINFHMRESCVRPKHLFLLILTCSTQLAYGLTLKDGRGKSVTISQPVKRIVSTFLGADEVLMEILVRCGKRHHLKAVSFIADDPRYSHIIPLPPSIKARAGTNIEEILKVKPDLAILASFNRPEFVRRLDH